MNNKTPSPSSLSMPELDLTSAVERFIQQGGVIHVVPVGETAEFPSELSRAAKNDIETEEDGHKKVELLKSLVAKGAGVNSLQYSLRMNKKDIKRMAREQSLKISYSRPVRIARSETTRDLDRVSDETAGHAMHYSGLGYNVVEIAQQLRLTVRQVWKIGRDYRFDFKQTRDPTICDPPTEE
jgi:hypothetical protein